MAGDLANLAVKDLLIAQAGTTTITGTSIDLSGTLQGGHKNVLIFLDIPTVAGTTPSVTVKMQDSPNNTTFTDVTGAAFGAVTTNLSGGTSLLFLTTNRYIRAVATFTANTTSATLWCGAVVRNEQS